MSDAPTPETAAAPTPVAEKPAKAPKAPKVELLKANGETRPRPGSKTVRPWEIADELSQKTGKPAVRKEVIEQAVKEGHSAAMAASQYGRWRRFHGLKREVKPAAPATPAATPAAAPASDVTVQS